MAIRPGSFGIRYLPQISQINPGDFDSGIADANAGFRGSVGNIVALENLRDIQRRGEIEANTQEARNRLAVLDTNEAVLAQPQVAKIRALQRQIAEIEAGEAIATQPEQAKLRALKTELAALTTQESISAQPEEATIRALGREETIQEFPAERARRTAQTTQTTAAAKAGAEEQTQRQAALEATRTENIRRAKTDANADIQENQTRAFAAGGAAARYKNEPKQTAIVETPEGTFRETFVEEGKPGDANYKRIVLERTQTQTPTEADLASRSREATISATEALAKQRLAPKAGQRAYILRDRHGASVGVMSPVVDRETGEILDWNFEPAPGREGTTSASVSSPGLPTTTTPAARTAAPAATVAPPAPPADSRQVTTPTTTASVVDAAKQTVNSPAGAYKVGAVYAGLKFLGGDPNDPKNWQRVR